ncbi:hypothetical protein DNTS_028854 [Danionella cerebrum]|uniref:Uncharacterized protein n=1 Tax=Danionella cerebrum TaxID=2873325 RepID=A0A553Q4Z2_9TELE|nr:hypothetical protein DNTS_028854 [Danionella translucida]
MCVQALLKTITVTSLRYSGTFSSHLLLERATQCEAKCWQRNEREEGEERKFTFHFSGSVKAEDERACSANLALLFLTLGILLYIVPTVRKGANTVPEPVRIQPLITDPGQSPCTVSEALQVSAASSGSPPSHVLSENTVADPRALLRVRLVRFDIPIIPRFDIAHRGDSPQVQVQEVTQCVASDHQIDAPPKQAESNRDLTHGLCLCPVPL